MVSLPKISSFGNADKHRFNNNSGNSAKVAKWQVAVWARDGVKAGKQETAAEQSGQSWLVEPWLC